MAQLGEYIKIKHGYAFKGDYISTEDNGIVLVTPGNFALKGGFKESKCKFFTSDYPEDYVLKENDLIVTMTDLSKDGDTLGYSAKIPKSKRTYLHNQRIGLVEAISTEIDMDYLYWFMRTSKYQKTVVATASGSTVKHTSPSRICEIEIDLPDINTQKRIANILNNIENKIIVNNEINNNLEEQAQAIFKSWFVNFEPFDGVMPSDWCISTLGDVSDMSAGGDKPDIVSDIETDTCKIPIYSNGTTDEGLYGYTEKAKIFDESVTVSARGTIGYVCLRQTPYVPIVRLISLVPKRELISAKFLYLFLKQLHIAGTGTTQQQLTVPNFKGTEIIIPSTDIMNTFTDIITPLFSKILDNKLENQKLYSVRDSLLPKLMSGELDLSEIDI